MNEIERCFDYQAQNLDIDEIEYRKSTYYLSTFLIKTEVIKVELDNLNKIKTLLDIFFKIENQIH